MLISHINMKMQEKKIKNAETNTLKKRSPQEKEACLASIVELSLQEPLLANNIHAFSKHVASTLNLSLSQARRDIEDVQTVMRALADIDYKKTIAQKILEYAHIKELALKQNNLNAYLGAVKAEAELLGLKRLSVFAKEEDEDEMLKELEEKKQAFLQKIIG